MSAIECKFEIPKVEGLTDNEMTVGRKAELFCEGEFPANMQTGQLQFVEKPETKYQIKLLKAQFDSSTKLHMLVTNYTTGPLQWSNLTLTDGKESVDLGPLQVQVASVIPKPNPAQNGQQEQVKQEPYGPIGPLELNVSAIYWIFLAIFIATFLVVVVVKVIRYVQRRNMIERLKEHDSALTPLNQFHQRLRQLQRTHSVFFGGRLTQDEVHNAAIELRAMLNLYLTRRFMIPANEWGIKLIDKDLKKYHKKVHLALGADLRLILNEYEHAFQNSNAILASDIMNLANRTRNLIEQMESLS